MDFIRYNTSQTRSPTPSDGLSQGYVKGSVWRNITTGLDYSCSDATDGAAVWLLSGNSAPHPSTLNIKPAHLTSDPVSHSIGSGDRVFFIPYVIRHRVTIASFIGKVTETAGSTGAAAMIGLYDTDRNTGYPNIKFAETGPVNLTSAATTISGSFGNILVNPGLIWVAFGIKGVTTPPSMLCINNVSGNYISSFYDSDLTNFYRYYEGTKTGDYVGVQTTNSQYGSYSSYGVTLTNGSPVVTGLQSTIGLILYNDVISSNFAGIPAGTTIKSIDSNTQITMTNNYTGTTTSGANVSFGLLNWTFGSLPLGLNFKSCIGRSSTDCPLITLAVG